MDIIVSDDDGEFSCLDAIGSCVTHDSSSIQRSTVIESRDHS